MPMCSISCLTYGPNINNHEVEEEEAEAEAEAEADETEQEECKTGQSKTKKRRTRGPTKMNKVAKGLEEKVEVEFNSLGEDVGKGSVTLSSFLGPLVREYVPVLLDNYRHIDEQTKYTIWEEIQVEVLLFNILHVAFFKCYMIIRKIYGRQGSI